MPSLYERLGGLDALMSVADAFVARAGADDRINRKFARSDIPRLKKEFVDQLCAATGGPCEYTGRQMTETHRGMAVTAGEWDAFFEDLAAVLNEAGVPKSDQDELVGLVAPLRGEIVEIESPETATPLTDNFEPAPPLDVTPTGNPPHEPWRSLVHRVHH